MCNSESTSESHSSSKQALLILEKLMGCLNTYSHLVWNGGNLIINTLSKLSCTFV